jgi:hypothetical protein
MMKPYAVFVLIWFLIMLFIGLWSGCALGGELAWKNPGWDQVLYDSLRPRMKELSQAKDIEKYCSNFQKLPLEGKIQVYAHLMVAIAKYESGYKPGTVFEESNGVDSIGLFQLSYGDRFCPANHHQGDLKSPAVNIRCAVSLFAYFVSKDGILASGGYVKYGAPPAKGAARYWSVLRVPDKKSKHHLAEIKALTAKAPGCQ